MTAEEKAKEDKPKRPPTPAELRKKAKEQEDDGLCNPASREIFTLWSAFGGAQHGLSPKEVLEMPAWLTQDFLLIMRYISDERDKVKRSKPKKPLAKGRR